MAANRVPAPPPAVRQKSRKPKKPFYKKWWFWLILVVFGLGAIGGGASEDSSKEETRQEQQDLAPEDPAVPPDGGEPAEPQETGSQPSGDSGDTSTGEDGTHPFGSYTLPSGITLSFYDSVRNDATGTWRLAAVSDSTPTAEYALEYYEEMFSSEDEVHAVWNAALGTTTRIRVSGGLLYVDTLEYTDGEENDAKLLFSGQLLDSRIMDIATGEVVESGGTEAPPEEPDPGEDQTAPAESEPAPPSPSGAGQPGAPESNPPAESEPESDAQPQPPTEAEQSEPMVWIPTNGGTKYHSSSTCSNMNNPRQVTVSEAEALGFTPCKRCYG